jgi:hypothetical protein
MKKPIIVWESLASVIDLPGLPDGAAAPRLLLPERPSDGAWPTTEAREAAQGIVATDLDGEAREILMVGQGVATAFGLASKKIGRAPVLLWWETTLWDRDATVCIVPEPTRDSHWYAEPENLRIVRTFLEGYFQRAEQVILFEPGFDRGAEP